MTQSTKRKARIMALCALATAVSILQTGCQSNGGFIGIQGHGSLNSLNIFPQSGAWGRSINRSMSSFYNIRLNGFKWPELSGGAYSRY